MHRSVTGRWVAKYAKYFQVPRIKGRHELSARGDQVWEFLIGGTRI